MVSSILVSSSLSTAIGVAQVLRPSLFDINGGFLGLESKGFAKSILKRMNFSKRKGTKTAKKVPDNQEELPTRYANSIKGRMRAEKTFQKRW